MHYKIYNKKTVCYNMNCIKCPQTPDKLYIAHKKQTLLNMIPVIIITGMNTSIMKRQANFWSGLNMSLVDSQEVNIFYEEKLSITVQRATGRERRADEGSE